MPRKFTALVDQSNKIEESAKDTVVAYGSWENAVNARRAVILPSYIKSTLLDMCSSASSRKKDAYFRIFAGAIHLLLEDPIERNAIKKVVIDEEYPGNSSHIKSYLMNSLIHNRGFEKNKIPDIEFDTVHDYQDPLIAHDYANQVRTNKSDPDVEKSLEIWKENLPA